MFRTGKDVGRRSKNLRNLTTDEQRRCAKAGPADATFFSINAGPSLRPAKKYCDITGLEAPYKAPGSNFQFHNAEVYARLQDMGHAAEQDFLKVRNANTVLR